MTRDLAAEFRAVVKPERHDPTIRYHICSAHICLTDTETGAVVISGRDGQPDLVITFADTDAARGFALNAVDVLAAKYDVTRP